MHINSDICADHVFHKGNELFRDPSQDHARIRPCIDVGERENEVGRRGDAAAHRETKKFLFRVHMSQDGRRRDPQLRRDVGQRGGLEPLYCEDPPRGFKKLIAGDPRRPAH